MMLRMTLATLALIVGAAIAGCQDSTPVEPTSSAVLKGSSTETMLCYFTYNPCCDEFVELCTVGRVVENDNGFHFLMKDFTGTGSSGQSYTGKANVTGKFHTAKRGETGMFVEKGTMVREDGCSYSFTSVFRYTIDNEGNFEVILDKWNFDCE